MRTILSGGAALVMGALISTSAGVPPTSGETVPSDMLDPLDPVQQARAMCGTGKAGREALMSRLLAASAAVGPLKRSDGTIALYPDLTELNFPVSTSSDQARLYFRQGVMLSYGFNHAGAVRSFREAQRLDPGCAMCWWGEAVALGPNINAPMDDRDRGAALAALGKAVALKDRATPVERALIEAAAVRYSADPAADRAALDGAYADAMLAVAARFPDHDDVAVLAAEAAMNTTPWNYWEADKRTSIGRSGEAIRLVEKVLARNPGHPQAAHLYIHLLEASDPARAEAAADRLATLPSTAGHLVHMPSHIYMVRGRYADSIRGNIAAARADEAWIRASNDQGLVRYGYYPHNVHFIVASAQMAGDMTTAIDEAKRLRTLMDPDTSAKIAWIQAIDAAPYLAMAQFAAPDDILAMPEADPRLPYAKAMRLYARAAAHAQKRDRAAFDATIAELSALRQSDAFADMIAQGVPTPVLLELAEEAARGRLAWYEGRYEDAVRHYRAAATLETGIPYMEPSWWYYPVSQSLGAALLRAGRPDEASQAFRQALIQTPNNGWALYGLAESEAAQGHTAEATAARRALDQAWLGNPAWLKLERL
ncbi:tetratricopeptide repeat protein [Brevundimonas lenta]|uniref:Tetratricopeptide (TPR) repeat protein n=1 Tax=Brevundimonas lenta TaxID=424796 RepID=A0A7W6JCN8_9CAUL|nr:tetratricopeptide repeat protein [Brevundimonas lenta]MBB4082601.1 tetratricopeptide (TPR) repeat protein [Brevundimonas lenta]